MTTTCPYCHYQGRMRRRPRASMILALLLLLCWVVPGILYLFFTRGYKYACPRCKNQLDVA